jgi:mono/diheme cytochrome c family protein
MSVNERHAAPPSAHRHTIRLGLAALMLVLVVTSVACGNAHRAGPGQPSVDLTSDALADGRHVFMRNCYSCHPNGQGGLGPALNNKPLPGLAIHTQVRQGIGAMPAFNETEITDRQLANLIDYLQELRRKK